MLLTPMWIDLARTSATLSQPFERLCKERGLSAPQFEALRVLREEGGEKLPSLALASRLMTPVPDITRLVDRLERGGLAKRERSAADRRIVFISSTPKGLAALAALDAPVRDIQRSQAARLTRKELAQLAALLEKARAGSA